VPGAYYLLAAIGGAALLHTLTHAEQTRYRGMSVEPLMMLIAMYGVVACWRYRTALISRPPLSHNGERGGGAARSD
jgi:hypothetical protein